ncbi:MAG TPA: hypothetical protein P5243_11040, partial [Bacteroidales bacterium]|nr:hypothetical protein [Bacteroidales bacterium]
FYVSYVATETNTGKQCESPKSKVSVVVNPLPDFTIQLSKTGTICYDDSDVEISVIPNTGTTISSVNYDINTDPNRVQKSGIKGYINPDAPVMGYTIPGLYPIQINAEVTNQFGCKITKNITNSVRWTSIPTITNVTEVLDIANTNPITITATGMAVNWYNSASKTGSLATNTNSYTTSITRTTVSNTTLYATQTLDGCESQTALGTIQVIDCPFAAPDATSIAACPGLPLADITATTTNTAIQWKWFDESNTVLPTSTATLTHGVANTTETIKKFYVQYEAYDSGSGKTCWSPKKEVTVQVYKKPMVFFTDAVHTLCYDSGPHFLENIVNMGNGNPNITWTINGETTGIKNGVVDPTFNGAQSGNYTVEAIITDSKGCTSTETC